MLLSNSVLHSADVVLQDFAFITTKLAWNRFAALIIAEWKSRKTQGRYGEFSAALGQIPTLEMQMVAVDR